MKKLISFLFLVLPLIAFAQKPQKTPPFPFSRSTVINDAQLLEGWTPDTTANANSNTFAVLVKAVYGNTKMNNLYFWFKGQPTSDSTASFMAKHWIIIPSGQSKGFWVTATLPTSYHNIIDWVSGINDALLPYQLTKNALTAAQAADAAPVQKINNKTGIVVLDKSDIGLSVVPNTDFTTAVSNNTTAITQKEPTIIPGTLFQYWRGDKTWQSLNAAIASYLQSKPLVIAVGSASTTVLLAANATGSVNLIFDKTMPDANYTTTQILATGTSLISITNKTQAGCTLNFKANISLGIGAVFSVVAYEQTP